TPAADAAEMEPPNAKAAIAILERLFIIVSPYYNHCILLEILRPNRYRLCPYDMTACHAFKTRKNTIAPSF
ncbi:hypothetical protein, partial [Nitrosospira multiformis]|uniref:hypothetical protein n=1 Tax=Nitrosospira multiformis TaxID=1231 RepID=UPI001C638A44